MTTYERAAQALGKYADRLYSQYRRELVTAPEAIDKFMGYVRCMVDNELCGEGFGANKFEEFTRRILK